MSEETVEERTTESTAAWWEGLEPGTLYGLEVVPVDEDGQTGAPFYLTVATAEAEKPPAPPMSAWSENPGEATDEVVVEWTEVERAHSYTLRLIDDEGEAVDEKEVEATEPGTDHRHTLEGEQYQLYGIEVVAHNEIGDATAEDEAGPHHWLGGWAPPEPIVSHATDERWEYDRATRGPAYMAGEVLVEGEPEQRDVLILDRLTFGVLYRPRVGSDGKWEVRNITAPPRQTWRAYMALIRDLDGAYNAEVIDHIRPVLTEED